MIYTCTMNPAIDHFIETNSYYPKSVNRTNSSELQPNGKGVNISFVLNMLNIENTAIGFIGGFTGSYIEAELNNSGILTSFIKIEEQTRINVFTNVLEENTEYKLVNKGPKVNNIKTTELLKKISQFQEDDILFVSGSLPEGVEENIYIEISKVAQEKGIKLILDVSSKNLLDCLPYKPYCIKPNDEELATWFGKENLTETELIYYGEKLVKLGAQRVLVSLGEDGCLYFDEKKALLSSAPNGIVVNTACSGDALLGTFVGHLYHGETEEEALKNAVAAGSSTAFTTWLTDFSDIYELKKQIKVKKIR